MKIGIALGSGSARGWAHIGILRALEEIGIKPDIVAGSSIGSLVGGAYAAGKLEEFEQWILQLDSGSIASFMDISWTGGGLIEGEKLIAFFEEKYQQRNIEDLPVSYGAVTTDLATGREVWLQKGDLGDAVRASIALPGLFTPAFKDDRWYIDGGIVNPVPISLCKAMGADVVIAVNLNGDIVGKHLRKEEKAPQKREEPDSLFKSELWDQAIAKISEKLSANETLADMFKPHKKELGMFEVISSSINIMQDRITRSRMAGDPPDVILSPRLAHFGMMDFDKADIAIQEGRKSVELNKEALLYYTSR
jgi:NTE family protein